MHKKDFELVLKILVSPKVPNFLLTTHEYPDGDAIGSMLALGLALEKLGKKVTYFSQDRVPGSLKFLPQSAKIRDKLPRREFDVIIALDAGEKKRLGLNFKGLRYRVLVNIDHHPQASEKPFGDLNLVNTKVSSTAEILYFLLKDWEIFDAKIATCLLSGIFTDTGSFQHANTSPRALEIAADLMKRGANLNKIARETYQGKSLAALKIWGRVLTRALQDKKRGVTLSAITQRDFAELGAEPEDLDGVVNIINTAEGTRYALLLSEQENNKIRASLRSEPGRGVNVARIAAHYGGGGHTLASGFTIKGRLGRKGRKWVIKK